MAGTASLANPIENINQSEENRTVGEVWSKSNKWQKTKGNYKNIYNKYNKQVRDEEKNFRFVTNQRISK